MKKKIIKLLSRIIICLSFTFLIIMIPIVYAFSLPKQYENTYLGAMVDKIENLNRTKGSKIVLIGGSNLPFGIDSELLSEKLEMPVVNMGLYAALGGKIGLDLSKQGISEGDIVIVAYEYSNQMYSLYTNPETTLQMLDANPSLLKHIDKTDFLGMIGGLPHFIVEKKKHLSEDNKPNPPEPYSRNAFNDLGDIKTSRPYNEMAELYDSNMQIEFTTSFIDSSFIKYLNEFTSWANGKKAQVLISFPPVNRLAVSSSDDEIQDFYDFFREQFDAPVISYPGDYIMDENYFYDSNYHLNDTGVVYRTNRLLLDIKLYNNNPSSNDIIVPIGSGPRPTDDVNPGDEVPELKDDFIWETVNNRIVILGLSEIGKTKSTITIPKSIDGIAVFKLENRAFADSPVLKEVNIPETISILGNSLFENSPALRVVNLALPSDITKPLPQVGSNLLENAHNDLKIYVAKSRYSQVISDYFWSHYASSIVSK